MFYLRAQLTTNPLCQSVCQWGGSAREYRAESKEAAIDRPESKEAVIDRPESVGLTSGCRSPAIDPSVTDGAGLTGKCSNKQRRSLAPSAVASTCFKSRSTFMRVPAIIPDEAKLQFFRLAKYKSVSDRVIKCPPILITTMKKVKKEEELADPKFEGEKLSIYNLQFVSLGMTETPKDQHKDKILRLSGKC
ncbi:poly [Culex quinquefasciatus]|uniref:Poly n=1 Tax=Culex quinquefasciatus TaxID=7176 RepID=B0WWB3_CULQU|nr:poly [Culex quinquefasciatus]|eukprot:XP_001861685.1 poly [Culex quinquefasciatus]